MVTKPGPGTEVRKARGQQGWGRMLGGGPLRWLQLGCETIGVREEIEQMLRSLQSRPWISQDDRVAPLCWQDQDHCWVRL